MRLLTNSEFQQNEIKRLNEKYNVEMFSSWVHRAKTYAVEQKIREFKKVLFKSKKTDKATSTSIRFDPKKLISKATANMNNIESQKYGDLPQAINENVVTSETFIAIYDFYRLLKVQKHAKRYAHVDAKKEKSLRKRLREPLKVAEIVLALVENLKKSTLQSIFISQQQKTFHSLTASKYLWSEKSLKVAKIITYIGFQKKAMVR